MTGFDEGKAGNGNAQRRRLADAFFLFETLALLRTSKLHWPEDWSAFMAVLSSEWFWRKNRKPWERYTQSFCGVSPAEIECAHRSQPK